MHTCAAQLQRIAQLSSCSVKTHLHHRFKLLPGSQRIVFAGFDFFPPGLALEFFLLGLLLLWGTREPWKARQGRGSHLCAQQKRFWMQEEKAGAQLATAHGHYQASTARLPGCWSHKHMQIHMHIQHAHTHDTHMHAASTNTSLPDSHDLAQHPWLCAHITTSTQCTCACTCACACAHHTNPPAPPALPQPPVRAPPRSHGTGSSPHGPRGGRGCPPCGCIADRQIKRQPD